MPHVRPHSSVSIGALPVQEIARERLEALEGLLAALPDHFDQCLADHRITVEGAPDRRLRYPQLSRIFQQREDLWKADTSSRLAP